MVAYGVDACGQREVIGLDVGAAETEAFWREFLRGLRARGLIGVRLCTSDAHAGLKTAIAQVLGCAWQRCTVHFLRDMLGHVSKTQQPMIGAAIRGIFQATSLAEARERLVEVVDKLAVAAPKVATLLEAAEAELLAFYQLPSEHWSKLRSTNPLERVNREIGRRTDVVGIFPNDAALLRLAGMLLIEQNNEWLVARRYLSQESLALVLDPEPAPATRRSPTSQGLSSPTTILSYTTNCDLTKCRKREFPFGLYGRSRPGRTAPSTAVPHRLLTRKRSQVQTLSRPPLRIAGQNVVRVPSAALLRKT